MPRAAATKLYRNFTKGLITEAGYLTYPDNASIDELNTVIKIKGSRSRRLGLDYEPSSIASTVTGFTQGALVHEHSWRNVGNDSEVNFLVVQVAGLLTFFDLNATPVGGSKKSFEVDLTTYKLSTATNSDIENNFCQMASGKGFLFVAHKFMDPLVIEYDADTDTISVLPIIIQIRDFDGVNDGLANDEQPTTLTPEHLYNLKNQGWFQPYTPATTGGGTVTETGTVSGTVNPYTGGYYSPYTHVRDLEN